MGTTHQSIGECEPEASDEEFTIAFQLAIEIGQLGPLRKYHQAGKPIPGDVVMLLGQPVPQDVPSLVADLLGHRQQYQSPTKGRPRRIASEARTPEKAERNAAWLVAFMLKRWRSDHPHKRVPRPVKDQIISDAIAEAAKVFHPPANTIGESNIRALLKSGRFVVPSRLQTRGNDWRNATLV